jgi:NADH-quinone oxidoreductase subunit N
VSVAWLGDFAPLAVDLILVLGALAVLLADLIAPPGEKRLPGWGALATLVVAMAATFFLDLSGEAWGGVYVGDALAVFFKRVFLAGAILAVLGSQHFVADTFPRRQGEYYLLVLCSVLGMSLLGGVRDVILLVVCFELMGIPLYVLAAYAKKNVLGVEGALKLYLVGAVSSVTMLYGLSLLFGLSGSTQIAEIAAYAAMDPSPIVLLGAVLALAGMGFKIGVFPFHMWVPDTYAGASTPVVAFLAAAPKAAGLAALVQLLLGGERPLIAGVSMVVIALAAATLVVGNFLALNQANVKRLLAYSGVAHMGFLLMALSTGEALGLTMLMFYLAAYVFTNVGAFLVVHAVARGGGDDTLSSFDGLAQRSGWLGLCMLAFLLSLAGIPFMAGFWAKLNVFIAAWTAGLEWLVVLGAVLSVLALFYYLRVVRAMFMNPPADGAASVRADWPTNVGIAVCLLFVVGIGLVPGPFVAAAEAAAHGFFGS